MQQLTITSKGLMEEKEALVAQIRELREAVSGFCFEGVSCCVFF